jgi:NAD-reducing hydrogenase small subunit
MSDKPRVKVATAWLGGCSGCHMSFLDLDERLIDLAELVEFTASPITDVKEIPEVDVGIVEGAVCNNENERVLRTMRARCKVLIALGDCAVTGNIPALRNQFKLEEVVARGFIETESTQIGKMPGGNGRRIVCERAVICAIAISVFAPGWKNMRITATPL